MDVESPDTTGFLDQDYRYKLVVGYPNSSWGWDGIGPLCRRSNPDGCVTKLNYIKKSSLEGIQDPSKEIYVRE